MEDILRGALCFKGSRGYSAYEIAVQNGYEGTEEQWVAQSITHCGVTSERPNAVKGTCFFDETLRKPIWFDGVNWVDSTGSVV